MNIRDLSQKTVEEIAILAQTFPLAKITKIRLVEQPSHYWWIDSSCFWIVKSEHFKWKFNTYITADVNIIFEMCLEEGVSKVGPIRNSYKIYKKLIELGVEPENTEY